MPLPNTPGAYSDCFEIWERAIQLRVGCRTLVGPSLPDVHYLRMRMHQARAIRRAESRRAYPKDHPLYDTSEYDKYKLTIKDDDDGDFWLYVEPHGNWSAVAHTEPIPADELGPGPDILDHRPAAPALEYQPPGPTDDPDTLD